MEKPVTPDEFTYHDYIRLYEKYENVLNSEEDKIKKNILLLNKITSLQRNLKMLENRSFWQYIKVRKQNRGVDNPDFQDALKV